MYNIQFDTEPYYVEAATMAEAVELCKRETGRVGDEEPESVVFCDSIVIRAEKCTVGEHETLKDFLAEAEKRARDNGDQAAAHLEELQGLRREVQLHKEAKWDAGKYAKRLRHLLRLARKWVSSDPAAPAPELTKDIDEALM